MAHLITSFITAMIAGLIVYLDTASFGLAFLAYTGAGMLVFMTVLLSAALATAQEDRMPVVQG